MKAIYIDAENREFKKITIEGSNDIKALVGNYIYPWNIALPGKNALFVSETAGLQNADINFLLPYEVYGETNFFAFPGNGIITGFDQYEDVQDVNLPDGYLKTIRFVDDDDLEEMKYHGKIAN